MQIQKQQQITELKPTFLGKLDLNLIIHSSQLSNGIKRGDYQHYRNYCITKIKKIRKSMNFRYSTPKTKFSKKIIEKERAEDSRVLQVLLFNAEKNWAHANQVKTEQNAKLKKTKGSRAKFTIINKLKRAAQWAKRLEEVCHRVSEKKSALEAEAYREYLEGLCLFETEKWSEASKSFIKCREILSELRKVSDSQTGNILRDKIDQVDQSIKYCTFKQSKGKQLSIAEILQMKKINQPSLQAKLDNLAQSSQQTHSPQDLIIQISGQRYPIKQPKILTNKNRVDQLTLEFAQMDRQFLERVTADEQFSESYFNFFTDVSGAYDELIRVVDKEKDDSKYTQGEKETLAKISLYYQEERLRLMIKRIERVFMQAYGDAKSVDPVKAKKGAPQTLAKLLTNTITILNQIIDIQKERAKISNLPVPIEIIKVFDDLAFYYRTLRLHFVAQVYYNNGKISEAYSLWTEAERCLHICKSKQKVDDHLFPLDTANKLVRVGKLNSWIEYTGKTIKAVKQVEQGVQNLKLNDTVAKKYSLEQLTKNPKLLEDVTMQQLSEMPVTQIPPPISLMPCRPIFYDLMDQFVKYPDIESKFKQQNKGGWFWNKLKIFK